MDHSSELLKKYDKLGEDIVDLFEEVKKDNVELNLKIKMLSERCAIAEKRLDVYNSFFECIFFNHELKPFDIWDKLQNLEQELLTFFNNICIKHNISYWLDCGTLLGAVRHGGFIPWDDDIDVGMMRKDFNKIYLILENEIKLHNLEEDLFLRLYVKNINNYVIPFIQFTYRYPNKGITMSNIDVFPYDFKKSGDQINPKLFHSEKNKFNSRLSNGEDPNEVVSDYLNNMELSLDVSSFIFPGVEIGRKNLAVFSYDVIFPLKTIKFKERYYPCPNDFDTHLSNVYGDYKSLPDLQYVANHGLVKALKNIEDIREQYDIAINKLSKINSLFDIL